MSSTKVILSVLAALMLQLVIARYLRFDFVETNYVDLVLVVIVYTSFGRNPLRAMLVGAGAGLVQDSFSGALLGTQSLIKTLIGFLIGSLSVRVALNGWLSRIIVVAAASSMNGFLFVGLHWLFGIHKPVGEQLARFLGWHLLVNVIVAIPIFRLLDLLMRERTGLGQRRSFAHRPRKLL